MNSTNGCTKDDIEKWLKPTLEKEGLEDYTVIISGSSEKGDGYLGDITFVNVCGFCVPSRNKVFHFVIKSGKRSKTLREAIPVRSAFQNEINFYKEVLPMFMKFQQDKGITNPFHNTPKCYDTLMMDEMEVLILENMKQKEFILNNRRNPLNKEHINIVISVYAKLHAISFAIKDQKPEVFTNLAGKLQDIFTMMAASSQAEEGNNVYQQIIDIAESEHENEIIEKCHILHEKSKKISELADPNNPYAVILHGDCWNNNFMFKYKEQETSPVSVCLLDFQLSRLGSPVCDLSYFLFTCLSKEDVRDFEEINNLYYHTLSNAMIEMGSDPRKMFPFEELLNQWKKFAVFGLLMLPSVIKLCVSDEDEVPDLVEAAEGGANMTTIFTETVRNVDQYRQRTIPILKLAIERKVV